MKPGVSVLERAFQLAATARYDNVSQIKRQLHSEGYDTLQISGPSLIKQLMTFHVSSADGTCERPGSGTRAGSFTSATRLDCNTRLLSLDGFRSFASGAGDHVIGRRHLTFRLLQVVETPYSSALQQ